MSPVMSLFSPYPLSCTHTHTRTRSHSHNTCSHTRAHTTSNAHTHAQNRELQIMRRLDHCNIIRLQYFFYSTGDKVAKVIVYHPVETNVSKTHHPLPDYQHLGLSPVRAMEFPDSRKAAAFLKSIRNSNGCDFWKLWSRSLFTIVSTCMYVCM